MIENDIIYISIATALPSVVHHAGAGLVHTKQAKTMDSMDGRIERYFIHFFHSSTRNRSLG